MTAWEQLREALPVILILVAALFFTLARVGCAFRKKQPLLLIVPPRWNEHTDREKRLAVAGFVWSVLAVASFAWS